MGKFSKSIETGSSNKEASNGQTQKPTIQLMDNRAENLLQLKLIEIANSKKGNESIQREAIEEEELQMKGIEEEELQLKDMEEEELQMKGMEEEELQMKGVEEEELQMKGMEEEELQMKKVESGSETRMSQDFLEEPVQQAENNTGLPDQLKSGVENLSGYSLDDVKVHYNSDKPTQLNAHAYAQGTDIHVAPGQEKHLPHEAWHVVQQKQGRVRPTRQLKGKVKVNDDEALEREADVMGDKSLVERKPLQSKEKKTIESQIVQRTLDPDVADSRMDDLVQRVLGILKELMIDGKNWEKIYGEKGGSLAETGVQKGKDALVGGSEKKEPSLKEKVVKEAMKRWWNSLNMEQKAKVISEGTSLVSQIKNVFPSRLNPFSSKEDNEKEKVIESKEQKQESWFNALLSDISSKDLETFKETYNAYSEVKKQVEEFEKEVTDLAKELGTTVGAKFGEFKTEREFVSKFEAQKVPLKVVKLEFEFLKESITEKSKYENEFKALSDALDTELQGPSGLINNPSRFTNKVQMENAMETCSIAFTQLKVANIFRNGTSSLASNILQVGKNLKDKLVGKSSDEVKKITDLQKGLVESIQIVCNKSWYKFTKGIFVLKPKGVTEVEAQLQGSGTNAEKLNIIRKNLMQPEIELATTEKEISKVDDDLSSSAKGLKGDLTIDNMLTETRSQKSTEKFGEKQISDSSKLADSALEKGRLELKKSELNDKIKGKNRHPLTQVFYNAIKGIEPDNLISLEKSITIFNQIGQELDSPKHTA